MAEANRKLEDTKKQVIAAQKEAAELKRQLLAAQAAKTPIFNPPESSFPPLPAPSNPPSSTRSAFDFAPSSPLFRSRMESADSLQRSRQRAERDRLLLSISRRMNRQVLLDPEAVDRMRNTTPDLY